MDFKYSFNRSLCLFTTSMIFISIGGRILLLCLGWSVELAHWIAVLPSFCWITIMAVKIKNLGYCRDEPLASRIFVFSLGLHILGIYLIDKTMPSIPLWISVVLAALLVFTGIRLGINNQKCLSYFASKLSGS